MTPPNKVINPFYKEILNTLQTLIYPCTIVVYGPARDHRTTYRGQHPGVFNISYCESFDQAWATVDCDYRGHPNELKIYSIPGNEYLELY